MRQRKGKTALIARNDVYVRWPHFMLNGCFLFSLSFVFQLYSKEVQKRKKKTVEVMKAKTGKNVRLKKKTLGRQRSGLNQETLEPMSWKQKNRSTIFPPFENNTHSFFALTYTKDVFLYDEATDLDGADDFRLGKLCCSGIHGLREL